jgi:hypothetical protein
MKTELDPKEKRRQYIKNVAYRFERRFKLPIQVFESINGMLIGAVRVPIKNRKRKVKEL